MHPAHPPRTGFVQPPLVLTEEPTRRIQLVRKYAEYVGRCGHPAPPQGAEVDYIFRCILLERLFAHNAVDLDVFEHEHRAFAWFNEAAFKNAVGVVSSYVNGQAVKGGTGLR
ncbi:MAG: hypothetical protein QY323_05240 [Patescibacteria group bacterium]|nr:MAG: hypothetical protein QY323_05240 [Patescibacteria group bacterium]